MAAPALDATGKWLFGDTPDAGTAAVLAATIVSCREEKIGSGNTYQTWVATSQGVSAVFAGKQAITIYQAIKDLAPIVT